MKMESDNIKSEEISENKALLNADDDDFKESMSWVDGLRKRAQTYKSEFLSKRLAVASQFVVCSKFWSRAVPTQDCDVLIVLPADQLQSVEKLSNSGNEEEAINSCDEKYSGNLIEDKKKENLMIWLLGKIKARIPELDIHVRHHPSTNVYGLYLTASEDKLLKGAEELGLRKELRSEYGGGYKEFVLANRDYFVDLDMASNPSKPFLRSEERQSIIRHLIMNLRACANESVAGVKFLEGQAILPILISKNLVNQILPLHNSDDLTYLRDHWVRAFFHTQPLDKICEYFGVKIAMYFAYLGHYTTSLLLPAFFGLVLFCLSGTNQQIDDVCFVVFAFFNVAWATLYLEAWKRQSAEWAYKWGTLDKEDELLMESRALFHGDIIKSPVTNRLEPNYPIWKRNIFRYFVSLPIIFFCLLIVFAVMWCILEFQRVVNIAVMKGYIPYILKFFPKIVLAICITIMDEIYKRIATWLNNKENYRLDIDYENNLIIKLVMFQSVNSFLSLFFIAFYLQDMQQLQDQLAALLITRQVIGNVRESIVPYIVEKLKLFKIGISMVDSMSNEELKDSIKKMNEKEGDEVERFSKMTSSELRRASHINVGNLLEMTKHNFEGNITMSQVEVESVMKKYEDTYEDYLEMLIQFGYVTLFSPAFPLAALCALLNNIIEIRSDAFKLCSSFQRPFSQRVENIGIWQSALELMSVVAVMVNSALIGMSDLADRIFPNWSTVHQIIFIVILEHAVLGLKLLVAYAIPDIPQRVAEEKARLEFQRREALKKMKASFSMGIK